MSVEDLALIDLWWNDRENLKVLVKTSIERSSEVQEEKVIQGHDVRCHAVRCTIVLETKSKASLIIKKAYKNLWVGCTRRKFTEAHRLLKNGKGIVSSSKLLCLQPTIDDYGIMRSNSRIVNAEFLSIETRHPVIPPRTSWFTELIIKQYHEDGHHSTFTNHTLAVLSARHCIISTRG